MYRKVLVPLDGSKTAEAVLAHVQKIAKEGLVGEVSLVKVVGRQIMMTDGGAMPVRLADAEQSKKYLETVETDLRAKGCKVSSKLLEGDIAEAIVDFAKDNDVDLIVLATHGDSGLRRAVFGSVAFKVLHDPNVKAPILLIRP